MAKHLRSIVGKPDWARSKTATEYVKKMFRTGMVDKQIKDRGGSNEFVFNAGNIPVYDRPAHREGKPADVRDDGMSGTGGDPDMGDDDDDPALHESTRSRKHLKGGNIPTQKDLRKASPNQGKFEFMPDEKKEWQPYLPLIGRLGPMPKRKVEEEVIEEGRFMYWARKVNEAAMMQRAGPSWTWGDEIEKWKEGRHEKKITKIKTKRRRAKELEAAKAPTEPPKKALPAPAKAPLVASKHLKGQGTFNMPMPEVKKPKVVAKDPKQKDMFEANSYETARMKGNVYNDKARSHGAWASYARRSMKPSDYPKAPGSKFTDEHKEKRYRQASDAAMRVMVSKLKRGR